MTPSEDLFQLIRSMTPSEKRYFRLYLTRQEKGGESNSRILFDIIEAQSEYNEEQVAESVRLHNENIRLPFLKNYLYNQILRSLRSFHHERSVEMKLRANLDYAEVLFKKDLLRQCRKVLRKTKKIALKYEKTLFLPEIHRWERRFIKALTKKKPTTAINTLKAEEKKHLRKFKDELNLLALYDDFLIRLRQNLNLSLEEVQEFDEAIQQWEASSEMETKDLSFNAKIAYNYIRAYNFTVKGAAQEALPFYIANMQLWEANPQQIKEEPGRYVIALLEVINISQLTGHYEDFIPIILKIRKLEGLPPQKKLYYVHRTYDLEMAYYLSIAEFERGEALVPEMEKFLEVNAENLREEHILHICHIITLLYFNLEKHSPCLKWVNRILNHKDTDERSGVQAFARILNLILHFEMENDVFLTYLFQSTSRYLRKKNSFSEFEKTVISSLKNLLKTHDSRKDQAIYAELQEQLIQIESGTGQGHPGLEYIVHWTESKIRNVPLAEVIKEKLHGVMAA